jgi:DUF2892 family protein
MHDAERNVRALAGTFVLASLALGWWVHPGFFLFTAFVGANLLQSGFSDTCPALWFFRKRHRAPVAPTLHKGTGG